MKSDTITVVRCRDCVWFAPLDCFPAAVEHHDKLMATIGGCLKKREGECGVCIKVTFSKERPVLTHGEGFCHRAERKE